MKIRYSQWIRDREISVNTLRFDPMNPRLVGVGKAEKAVIQALAADEDIETLLRRIIRYGLAPIERLVVIYLDDKPIVIEGNRRLAVYKMLLHPEKAPKSLAGLVKTARNELGDQEIPRKLGCDIPRDTAEAAIYAYMKHAEEKHFKPWAKIQQAVVDNLYADAKDRGEAVPVDLSDKEIGEARAMVQFYRLAGILSRDPANGIKSDELRDFPYEAVRRTFLAKEIGPMIGISIDEAGAQVRGDIAAFTEFFRKTLSKMGEGRATRVFNTVKEISEWVKNSGYSPKGATFERLAEYIEKLDSKEPVPEPERQETPPKKKKIKVDRRRNKVFPEPLNLEYAFPRLESLIEEIEKIDVTKQKNVAGVMLRCVLELAVEGGIKERNLKTKYDSSLRGGKDVLSHRVQWIRDSSGLSLDRETNASLKALIGSHKNQAILDSLNSWVHSRWCRPSSEDVRDRALELTPLIQFLLSKA